MMVDEEIEKRCYLKWVRLLVHFGGSKKPNWLMVVDRGHVNTFQLWWEPLPWVSRVSSKRTPHV